VNSYWLCSVLLLLLSLPVNAFSAMQLIYPADKSWVYRSDYIILKTNETTITGVRMTVNGSDGDIIQINSPGYLRSFQDILIVQPVWDKGKNTLVIEGFKGNLKTQSISAEIFYNPLGDRSLVPAGFNAMVLHTPENDKICALCHVMTSAGGNAASSASGPCATCHRKLAKVKYPHEPVTSFTCAYCHTKNESPRFGVTRRDTALCYDCHADKADEIKKFAFQHGPVTGGMCEICHDSHGTDFPAFMRRPINEVCFSCHENIRKIAHVAKGSGGKGHPLSGVNDISEKRKGKELACVSCHSPHGGMVRNFFISNSADRMKLCQSCHAK
jgi:predicted CXXCH cytochrome family protein